MCHLRREADLELRRHGASQEEEEKEAVVEGKGRLSHLEISMKLKIYVFE